MTKISKFKFHFKGDDRTIIYMDSTQNKLQLYQGLGEFRAYFDCMVNNLLII